MLESTITEVDLSTFTHSCVDTLTLISCAEQFLCLYFRETHMLRNAENV